MIKGDHGLTNKDLQNIFNRTRDVSWNEYRDDTQAAVDNVEVIEAPIEDIQFMPHPIMPNKNMHVSVVDGGTAEIGMQYARKGLKVAVLNFADAITPGGLVVIGAPTQEENLCRCSNLYETLLADKCQKNYYIKNVNYSNKYISELRGVYTDTMIYSNAVLFFRDDATYEYVEPVYMDVITCPAPSVRLSEDDAEKIIDYRAEFIVKSAALHRVDVLVLGAWGCGAFGQSPEIVSKAFNKAICKYKAFDSVIFAIRKCRADSDKADFTKSIFQNNIQEN